MTEIYDLALYITQLVIQNHPPFVIIVSPQNLQFHAREYKLQHTSTCLCIQRLSTEEPISYCTTNSRICSESTQLSGTMSLQTTNAHVPTSFSDDDGYNLVGQ